MKFRAAFRALSRGHVHLEDIPSVSRQLSQASFLRYRPEPVPSDFLREGPIVQLFARSGE